jgi:hypothetical protein
MLNYVALALLILIAVGIVYGIIAIHDIPHRIAVARNHPHQDAIQVAGWVSLFTLHAIWPILWIWAMAYRPDRGWGVGAATNQNPSQDVVTALARLEQRLARLEADQRRPSA